MSESRLLTRAQFRHASQCEKRLWLSAHSEKNLHENAEDNLKSLYQWNFSDLRTVVRQHFSANTQTVLISDASHTEAIEQTRKALEEGATCLFNARLTSEFASARMDVLQQSGDTWHAYEIRPVVGLKPRHFEQAAFNFSVLSEHFSSLRYHILYVNKRLQMGEIEDFWELIREEDITPEVRGMQGEIVSEVTKANSVLKMPEAPDVPIGPHCNRPHECPFKHLCWGNHLSQRSVLQLSHADGTEWDLYAAGYHEFDEVPSGWPLTPKQRQQVEAWKTGELFIDREALTHWLSQLKWPVICLDFETFNPLLSPEPGCNPLTHIPFQFSSVKMTNAADTGVFSSFLAKAMDGYMDELIRALLDATKGEGTILAYGAEHERKMIRQLMRWYPKYLPELEQRLQRISDLIVPFRNRWLYVAEMNGSASIKKVIPAFSPEMSFNELHVSNGKEAAEMFEMFSRSTDHERRKELIEALNTYSEHDVRSMSRLLSEIAKQL